MIFLLVLNDSGRSFFDSIYHRFRAAMWFKAYEITADKDKADDVVQTAFARLMDKTDLLLTLPEKQLKAYIIVTVKHAAIRYMEKSKQLSYTGDTLDLSEYITSEDEAQRHWEQAQVRAALGCLPAPDKEILFLRYKIGLDIDTISQRCGCTNGAARTRISRAITRLRVHLLGKKVF